MREVMTLSDLARWAGIACLVWLALAIATGCTHSTHVRAVNTTAATLETTSRILRAEFERGKPQDPEDRKAYAQRWMRIVYAQEAAYAAHDAWRRLVADGASEVAILAAAERVKAALCVLSDAIQYAAPRVQTGALCGARTGDGGLVTVPGT